MAKKNEKLPRAYYAVIGIGIFLTGYFAGRANKVYEMKHNPDAINGYNQRELSDASIG